MNFLRLSSTGPPDWPLCSFPGESLRSFLLWVGRRRTGSQRTSQTWGHRTVSVFLPCGKSTCKMVFDRVPNWKSKHFSKQTWMSCCSWPSLRCLQTIATVQYWLSLVTTISSFLPITIIIMQWQLTKGFEEWVWMFDNFLHMSRTFSTTRDLRDRFFSPPRQRFHSHHKKLFISILRLGMR